MIRRSAEVFRDGVRARSLGYPSSGSGWEVLKQVLARATQPWTDRCTEAFLGSGARRIRNNTLHRGSKDTLGRPTSDVVTRTHLGGEVSNAVIKKWRPYLESVSPRRTIHLHQDAIG